MTVFSWASRRVRWAAELLAVALQGVDRQLQLLGPLDARGPPAAVLGQRTGPLLGRRPLGQVGTAVRELVGQRVEALELQQVVGQHAATVRAGPAHGTHGITTVDGHRSVVHRSVSCGWPRHEALACTKHSDEGPAGQQAPTALDNGVDGIGARGSRTSGGTVVPPSTATRRVTTGAVIGVPGASVVAVGGAGAAPAAS